MERRSFESDPLQRPDDPEEEEEISLSSADESSRNGSRDELVVQQSPASMRRERRSPAPEEEEEGEEDLEKKRMVSESEAGDEDVLEFGHTTNCYSLFVQGAVGYFYANRHRLRGVLLASTLVAALLIIAVLFISIYDPDAATTERTSTIQPQFSSHYNRHLNSTIKSHQKNE